MLFNYLLCDPKSQAGAKLALGREKRLEDPYQLRGPDTSPIVSNRNPNVAAAVL